MTAAAHKTAAPPSFASVKMDERKRSLAVDMDVDVAPSRKRLAKDENGQPMRMDAEKEKEVENFQKDAIMRQLKEYKREKETYERRLNKLLERTQHHDEQLRMIDTWFTEMLNEIRAGAEKMGPPTNGKGSEMFKSALLFEDHPTFAVHLAGRTSQIKDFIDDIYGRFPPVSDEKRSLQEQFAAALASEKVHIMQCQSLASQKESLDERLEEATSRYMAAEKKLDRVKSAQVQKLERQAMFGGNNGESSSGDKAGTPVKTEHSVNGELANGIEGEKSLREAESLATQRKQQLEELENDNARLTNELSAARTRLASLSDEDYADTGLYKAFKSQHTDMIKKLNELEALNLTLQEEAKKSQATRTAYRLNLDQELRAQNEDLESQIGRLESDLARVRGGRDEAVAERDMRKTGEENRRTSADMARELAEARDSRIRALESELERWKIQRGETSAMKTDLDSEDLDTETLKAKVRNLESQYAMLSNELPSMEAAWKKTQAMAAKKVAEVASWEDQIARLSAEKAKADQKYFATMKAKDARDNELKLLANTNKRSSEIVSQLKDSDGKNKELVMNYERQAAESREIKTKLESLNRTADQKLKEATTTMDGLRKQIEEMKTQIVAKDKEVLDHGKKRREYEESNTVNILKLEESKKAIEALKKQKSSWQNSDSDDWRALAICSVCNGNIRDTVLKNCGHVFCGECVNKLVTNRSRRCPSCQKSFGLHDSMRIHLTG